MTQVEKENVIKELQDHLDKVEALQFEDYFQADSLYKRAEFFYKKYFKKSDLYADDFLKINFRSVKVGTSVKAAWDESHGCLLSFSQSMLDELQLPQGHFDNASNSEMDWQQQKILYSGIFLIMSSIVLWSFNTWAKWEWLSLHQKRIGIYLSFQVAIALVSALFLTKNKQVRAFEWIMLALAMAAIIISSVA